MALENDHVEVARLLLERGANSEATDERVSVCVSMCAVTFVV